VMRVVGLDIGGANLKAADSGGHASTRPFAVWKTPELLAFEIEQLLADFSRPDLVAVTMTAELADCFRTKRQGVDAILTAVEHAAGTTPIAVWQTAGRFVDPRTARDAPISVAAANWHALATFVGKSAADRCALLIDAGSTTTDLIPIDDGAPTAAGRTDRERLQSGELVYTGVRRTPLCAVVSAVPYRGRQCRVAAELFATTLDVYLTIGDIPERPECRETADGRPQTISFAHQRLARCLCCDESEFTFQDARAVARFVAAEQSRQIGMALQAILARQTHPPDSIFLSGSGIFLARRTIVLNAALRAARQISLSETYGPNVAEAACAFAVARLAAECD
jgi:(4-(4-[2-(gamma-L-glutamylamino)ethyl]phenoxymethyl)furan-2-yl)methanamine synthase